MFCRNGKCCIDADLKCENEFAFKDKTGKEIIFCTDAEADDVLKDETIKVKLSEMKNIVANAKAKFVPKLIKVEDRLPEESGLYLILCREENTLHNTVEFNPYLDMYYPNSNPTSWERWSNDYYDKSKVVAWMPIPKYEEAK